MDIGTTWAKWDLHVHTPDSMVQNYGGDWGKFLDDLELLDPYSKVLGINDYLFLDGYKKVQEARTKGRIPNIEAVFPVIEIRLEQLAGVTGPHS